MKLVCVVGIDGTGKTTLARSATAALRQQGITAAYVYGRTYPVLSRALMALGRATFLRRHDQARDYQGYSVHKQHTMRNPWLAGLYSAAILVDYYVQLWLKLLPHVASQRIVVADRYVYDTVINDLAVHLGYTDSQAERGIERGLRVAPVPLLTVLIDIPEEIAFARKDDVIHIDYLRERRGRYLALRTRPEVVLLDGQASREDLLTALLRELARRCPETAQGVAP